MYLFFKTYLSEDSATESENSHIDAEYAPTTSAEPHFPTKQELDDLIRDLDLTKSGAVDVVTNFPDVVFQILHYNFPENFIIS